MRIRRNAAILTLTCTLVAGGGVLVGAPASAAVHHGAKHHTTKTTTPVPGTVPLPANPKVYFFGDSWTKGASAEEGRGFPTVLGQTLGWTVELGPDNSGAGYVHTYDPSHALFPESAAALPAIDADLIVLEGGLNDAPGPLTQFWDRVALTVKTLRAKSHDAPIVLVGPAFPDGTVPAGIRAIDAEEAGVAKQLGLHYVSPVQEQWFTPRNVGGLMDPVTFHPNTAGHAYYAGRLAADLQRFVGPAPAPTSKHASAKHTKKHKKQHHRAR